MPLCLVQARIVAKTSEEGGEDAGDLHVGGGGDNTTLLRTVAMTVLGSSQCGRWRVWSYYRRRCVWGVLW